jgi:hypothetical protein
MSGAEDCGIWEQNPGICVLEEMAGEVAESDVKRSSLRFLVWLRGSQMGHAAVKVPGLQAQPADRVPRVCP